MNLDASYGHAEASAFVIASYDVASRDDDRAASCRAASSRRLPGRVSHRVLAYSRRDASSIHGYAYASRRVASVFELKDCPPPPFFCLPLRRTRHKR